MKRNELVLLEVAGLEPSLEEASQARLDETIAVDPLANRIARARYPSCSGVLREPLPIRANRPLLCAPILAISENAEPQELRLCRLWRRPLLCKLPVLPDRDDRQFCRHNMLVQNMKRIQATG